MTVITVMVVAVDVGWICVVVVIVVMFMVVVMMMVMMVVVMMMVMMVVVMFMVVTGLMHKINVVAMRCLTLMCYVFWTTSRVHGN
jgi:hypothetical protein